MKWIGQHIYDLVSRFRNDVYLEDIDTGTIASGGNLGLDSNNKIVKAVEASGDITGVTITTDSGGGSAASDTGGSADFSILGATGVDVTNSGTTITATSVPGEIDHDSLLNFVANEHIDWTGASAGTIHATNYTNTTYSEATGSAEGLMSIAHHDKLDGIETGATADQTQADIHGLAITTVGTISSGTWQGTAVASAYLDADTAHYSATKQFTYHMFKDDIDTTKHYIGLQEADAEGSSAPSKNLPFTAGVAGKLLKVFLRSTGDLSGKTLTWRLETVPTSQDTGHAPTVIGTQSGAGCTDQTMTIYDFTTSLDSGDNIIDVGDQVLLSIESSASTNNFIYYVTCLWEWDLG
jgi:hypothetical protein